MFGMGVAGGCQHYNSCARRSATASEGEGESENDSDDEELDDGAPTDNADLDSDYSKAALWVLNWPKSQPK